MSKLNENPESSDMNEGTLPFSFTVPLNKYVLENGKPVCYTLAEYHLKGITRGPDHAILLRIEKECGEYDPDILIDLEMMDNREKMEEWEHIAVEQVNRRFWKTNTLTVAQ